MNCPQCKHSDIDGRNFCGACGGRLVRYCSRCGFRNLQQDRFCGGCGASFQPVAARSAREVTAAGAPRPSPPPSPAAPASPLAELIEAARDTERVEDQDGDAKVSQDDIDSLFGD